MGVNTYGLTDIDAAYQGIFAVKDLIKDLELPTSLREIGVKKNDLKDLSHNLLTSSYIKVFFDYFTFRKTTEENALQLLEQCWEGSLKVE